MKLSTENGSETDAGSMEVAQAGKGFVRRISDARRRYGIAFYSGIFFILVVLSCIFAPLLTPYDPLERDIPNRLEGPSLAHPFGTDEFGRDLLARTLYGGRPILAIGFLAVLSGLVVGTVIGTVATYWGQDNLLEDVLMRLTDVMLSFPATLLAILIVASIGAGLLNVAVAIGFSLVPQFARLVRSVVITLIEEDFVVAADAMGAKDGFVVRKHVFPNMIPPIIVQATGLLATAIATSSALSFLGLGIEPPTPDWGLMVSEGQRLIFDAPHVVFFPGVAITLTVLAVNFVGDGLRDLLDPRMRHQGL
jgi:peptide/nickel transport system permease protein/oligopeptide transport system permease protein